MSDDRFALLELDTLTTPSAPRASRPAPATASAPAAPTALEGARALLLGARDERSLEAAVGELVKLCPDTNHPIRVALRPMYRALCTALLWARMWTAFARAVEQRPELANAARAVRAPAQHVGEYRKHNGEWRGWISNRALLAPVRVGDRVVLQRRDGTRSTLSHVTAIISAHNGGTLIEFGDAPVAPVASPAAVRQAIPVVVAPEVATPMPASSVQPGTLIEALGLASSESAANAATQASGSLASGTMASVGFTSAAGYVQALANGVKRATADGYLATLRSRYSYTQAQIDALTVTIVAEPSELPVGPGIVHEPTGPDIFTQRRAERTRAANQIRATADAATVALAQTFTTGAQDAGAWWEIGWDGNGSITRGEILAACGDAPEPKAPETQLSRTCDSLRGTHDCAQVNPPQGVRRRWQIGRGRQHSAYVGAEYGRILAIVDLMPNGQLRWEGDSAICEEVRAEYERLCNEEVLRPGDITAWLSSRLRYRFMARKQAHNYLVPPEFRDAARELCTKLANVWARGSWVYGRLDATTGKPEIGKFVTDIADVLGGLLVACSDEVTAAEEAWQVTVDAATQKASKVGARAAASALLRHDGDKPGEGLLARVNGLAVLGEGPLAPLRARCAALRAKILAAVEAANDAGTVRSTMLELE